MDYDMKVDTVLDVIDYMEDAERIDIWNRCSEEEQYYDDLIHRMETFDDHCKGLSASEVVQATGEDFDLDDDYFRYCCGTYCSFSDLDSDYCPIEEQHLAEYIVDNDNDLGSGKIRAALEQIEAEDDEEEE